MRQKEQDMEEVNILRIENLKMVNQIQKIMAKKNMVKLIENYKKIC